MPKWTAAWWKIVFLEKVFRWSCRRGIKWCLGSRSWKLACSRLGDSRVREIEKARARQQNGKKLGRGRAYIFACSHNDMHMGIPIPKTLVTWASPVTLTLTLSPLRWCEKEMPISLGFWEWRRPKRGDAHVTSCNSVFHLRFIATISEPATG